MRLAYPDERREWQERAERRDTDARIAALEYDVASLRSRMTDEEDDELEEPVS